MRIEREHTAALIVDFQERLVPAIADHEALMERVRILLRGLKALEIPMTVTQQYTKGLGFWPTVCLILSSAGMSCGAPSAKYCTVT